jgi:hypothetical protein
MIEDRPACEQAPALAAGRHCNALNHNAGSLQKVINIARRFTPKANSSCSCTRALGAGGRIISRFLIFGDLSRQSSRRSDAPSPARNPEGSGALGNPIQNMAPSACARDSAGDGCGSPSMKPYSSSKRHSSIPQNSRNRRTLNGKPLTAGNCFMDEDRSAAESAPCWRKTQCPLP